MRRESEMASGYIYLFQWGRDDDDGHLFLSSSLHPNPPGIFFFLFFALPPTFFVAFRYDKRRREGRPFSIHFF
jgi:hypothetical protein